MNGKARVSVIIKGIGTLPARPHRRKKPGDKRGNNPDFVAQKFKPGNTFWKNASHGTKLPRFSDAYEVALLQEVPAPLRKQLGVPKGTTMMDLLVSRVVEQAAVNASIPHVTEVRETVAGKNPDRRITLTASLNRLMEDPEFQRFVEQRLDEYLAQEKGTIHGSARTARELGGEVPGPTEFELES